MHIQKRSGVIGITFEIAESLAKVTDKIFHRSTIMIGGDQKNPSCSLPEVEVFCKPQFRRAGRLTPIEKLVGDEDGEQHPFEQEILKLLVD